MSYILSSLKEIIYRLSSELSRGVLLGVWTIYGSRPHCMAPSDFPVGLGERVRFDTKSVWVDYNNLGPNGCSDS